MRHQIDDSSDEESSDNKDDYSMPELQIHLPYDSSDDEISESDNDGSMAPYQFLCLDSNHVNRETTIPTVLYQLYQS